MIERVRNAWLALKMALSRDRALESVEDAHRKIGALIESGAPVEAVERQMIEENWKQQVCDKKDALRVDFYFALVALLAIIPTFVLAKDWLKIG